MNLSGIPTGLRPGVTYACLYQTHNTCQGWRMDDGRPVAGCCCPCHTKDGKK